MDFERIALLLGVFHSSLDVPKTDNIRNEIMKELHKHNSMQPIEVPAEVIAEQKELNFGARKL